MFDILTEKGLFNLKKPKPDMVDLKTMARAMSRVARYSGHTSRFYSVASHSLLVASFCSPQNRLQALLHDAAEAYTGDISTPLKNVIGVKIIDDIEKKIIDAIYGHIGIAPRSLPFEVIKADTHALYVESFFLFDAKANAQSVFGKYQNENLPLPFDFIEGQIYKTNREVAGQYLDLLQTEIAKHKGGEYGTLHEKSRNDKSYTETVASLGGHKR